MTRQEVYLHVGVFVGLLPDISAASCCSALLAACTAPAWLSATALTETAVRPLVFLVDRPLLQQGSC